MVLLKKQCLRIIQIKGARNNMKNDKWTVESLSKTQEKALASNDFNHLERYGDFGSYRRVLLGDVVKDSMLGFHNSLKPGPKVDFCHGLLNRRADQISNVLDVGCGMGYTAKELARLYKNAKVVAVDISSDAVEYGTKNFPEVDFVCQAIEPENPVIGQFDIIFAFEFYPFTRTSDSNVHLGYLKYFLSMLNADGQLLIHLMWGQCDSIFSTIRNIEKELPEFKFSIHNVPSEKVHRIVKIPFLSVVFDSLARLFLSRAPNKGIVISRI